MLLRSKYLQNKPIAAAPAQKNAADLVELARNPVGNAARANRLVQH
jgi:hypothetical protein